MLNRDTEEYMSRLRKTAPTQIRCGGSTVTHAAEGLSPAGRSGMRSAKRPRPDG